LKTLQNSLQASDVIPAKSIADDAAGIQVFYVSLEFYRRGLDSRFRGNDNLNTPWAKAHGYTS